jgi:MFS family permease
VRARLRAAARTVLVNREYARLWWGQAVSSVGDSVFSTTLVLWVGVVLADGRAWAPAAVSGILIADGAAFALVGPLAGVLVDRWDRKKILVRAEMIRTALAAALTAASFVAGLPVWAWLAVVYLSVFSFSAAGQFFTPARLAVTGQVVHGEADQARATGIAEAMTTAAGFIGPPIAAPLLFTAGIHWALAANAVSYAFSCLAVRSVSLPPRPAPGTAPEETALHREFWAGLRLFARNRYLAALLTVTVICQFGTGAVTALNLFFVTRDLHASARLFGITEMVMGGAFIAGSLWSARLVARVGARTLIWSGLLAAGAVTAAYALQRNFPAGMALLACYSGLIGLLNTATAPLLLAAAPPDFIGRVSAVYTPANQLASSLSIVMWGCLASTVLHGFRATLLGVHVNSASLIFVIAAALITASGIRAFTALPAAEGRSRAPGRHRRLPRRSQNGKENRS